MGLITDDNLIICGKGSSNRANSVRVKGQPWRDDLDTGDRVEQMLPVKTIAEGFEYNNCIIFIKSSPKPIAPKTDHKKGF